MTFLGLSGIGDLYVTCTSPLSRNFRVGVALGRGKRSSKQLVMLDRLLKVLIPPNWSRNGPMNLVFICH